MTIEGERRSEKSLRGEEKGRGKEDCERKLRGRERHEKKRWKKRMQKQKTNIQTKNPANTNSPKCILIEAAKALGNV